MFNTIIFSFLFWYFFIFKSKIVEGARKDALRANILNSKTNILTHNWL